MMITKSVFSRDVSTSPPKVGDAIKTLWNNKTYEVVDVGADWELWRNGLQIKSQINFFPLNILDSAPTSTTS
jgi:hypothetical protein